jgi:hypothetical protein
MSRLFAKELIFYLDSGLWDIAIREHVAFAWPTTKAALDALMVGNEIYHIEKGLPSVELLPAQTHEVYEDGIWKKAQFGESIQIDVAFYVVDYDDFNTLRSDIINGARYDLLLSKKANRGLDYQLYKTVILQNVPILLRHKDKAGDGLAGFTVELKGNLENSVVYSEISESI